MKSTQLETFLNSLKLGLSFVEDLPAELDSNYKTIKIRSRSPYGKIRVLRLPDEDLKWIQSRILKEWLAPNFSFSDCVQGGVKGRSTRTNAVIHQQKSIVLNLDLLNFFDSINPSMVKASLQKHVNYPEDLCSLLAFLCTVEGMLPQGSPTSTFLANLVAIELDQELMAISASNGLSYSRYVDDLTFSGDPNVDELIPQINRCIESQGFAINVLKTRIQRHHKRQTVTKVVVNQRTSVAKEFLQRIRHDLHYCKKYGAYGHCTEIGEGNHSNFMKRLAARIGYVISIDADKGRMFLKQFRELPDYTEVDKHCVEFQAQQEKLKLSGLQKP